MSKENQEKNSGLIYVILIILMAAVCLIWFYYPSWMSEFVALTVKSNKNNYQTILGTFGDSFGALNTLFSGLAFTGIICSIFLQSKELKETRKEIKAQGDQFELQTKALNQQAFENTFFQLIHLHNEIIESIRVNHTYREGSAKGRDSFKCLFVDKWAGREFCDDFGISSDSLPADTESAYLLFHDHFGDQLGHYFRNIYQILKYIDRSNVEDKKFYSNLLRAQLSSYELGMLYLNCLSGLGNEKFKPLVEKYKILKHLPHLDRTITKTDLKKYDRDSFSENKEILNIIESD